MVTTREYQQSYYYSNRERILKQKKEYQQRNREKINEKNRNYYQNTPAFKYRQQERMRKYKRAWRMHNMYNLTEEDYELMFAKQNGVCAICKTDNWGNKGVPSIDHDHFTGKVRGLLCVSCNHGLGRFKDSLLNLFAAAEYLYQNK